MAYRATAHSRTNQRWMLTEQASQLVLPLEGKAGAGTSLPPLQTLGGPQPQTAKTPAARSPSKAVPSSQRLQEAFREVEELLRARPTMPTAGDKEKEGGGAGAPGEVASGPQPSMTKATSAPALLKQPTKRVPAQNPLGQPEPSPSAMKRGSAEKEVQAVQKLPKVLALDAADAGAPGAVGHLEKA
ncbi:unnamed protein product [Symbiodinium natans]|uniref:Uncharacterized protein n=1 Tax=Symbiodinium natans TaxID=878477 RepID=A0A812KBD2_9DINO|nr:unnamed protein product [Symbiodinium natans]